MFGEKLTEKRTEKNLTQEQLAEKLYVTRQAVSRWETNKTQPDLQTLGRICSILDVSPEYFIETDRQEISYKGLPYSQKLKYYQLFTAEYMKLYFISSLTMALVFLALNGLSFTVTLAIIDLLNGTFGHGAFMWFSICMGLFLMVVALFFLALYFSNMRSTVFNNWLAQRNVVRTKKFL